MEFRLYGGRRRASPPACVDARGAVLRRRAARRVVTPDRARTTPEGDVDELTGFEEQFLEVLLVGVQLAEQLLDGLGVGARRPLTTLDPLVTFAGRLVEHHRRLLRLLQI